MDRFALLRKAASGEPGTSRRLLTLVRTGQPLPPNGPLSNGSRLRLGGLPGARRPGGGEGVGVVAGLGAELGELVAVGIGLVFGALAAPAGRRAARRGRGRRRAEIGQHLLRIGVDPAGLRLGGLLGSLRAGGIMLRQPSCLVRLLGPRDGLVPVGLGGVDPRVGVLGGRPRLRHPGWLPRRRGLPPPGRRAWVAAIWAVISSAAASASARHWSALAVRFSAAAAELRRRLRCSAGGADSFDSASAAVGSVTVATASRSRSAMPEIRPVSATSGAIPRP